ALALYFLRLTATALARQGDGVTVEFARELDRHGVAIAAGTLDAEFKVGAVYFAVFDLHVALRIAHLAGELGAVHLESVVDFHGVAIAARLLDNPSAVQIGGIGRRRHEHTERDCHCEPVQLHGYSPFIQVFRPSYFLRSP